MIRAWPTTDTNAGRSPRVMMRSGSLPGHAWWRRRIPGGVAALSLGIACLTGTDAGAQGPADLMRLNTKDLALIAAQVRAAVPPLQRGLALITTSQEPGDLTASFESSRVAYRYLRKAQANTETVISLSKNPDPVLVFQKDRMSEIRRHLLNCSSTVAHGEPRQVSHCADNFAGALQKLRALVVTLP